MSTLNASKVSEISETYEIATAFNLLGRLTEAARDYQRNSTLDDQPAGSRFEKKQEARLKTLGKRVGGARPARVRETLLALGFSGAVELGICGWNGDPLDPSLGASVQAALKQRSDQRKGGKRRRAREWWIFALVCIYAEATHRVPSAGRAAGKSTKGALAKFIEERSSAAGIDVGQISYSTLRRIVNSPGVAHFAAK